MYNYKQMFVTYYMIIFVTYANMNAQKDIGMITSNITKLLFIGNGNRFSTGKLSRFLFCFVV